ncbi:urea carboxylase [Phormidium sp. CLA17]|uniref:urea carboxylase n=1 Tax=Leptolyngbya sp. Cla-17 TaxID=2803751 RepID=UPI0014922712|nr:urea carboxylase [Leptolyngbya sp. Cla-17]MBM0742590.1 urea carboxylase [Leptolyngbya sp. Cla-17]
MFNKVLIANRGEIACRVIRTLDRLGIASVAVYSEADAPTQHVSMATEAVCIGAAPVAESYLKGDRILEVAQQTGAQAIHPGYGFLSENIEFAEACEAAGIAFIGPTPQHIRQFGLKHTARELAEQNQVPLVPGTGLLKDIKQAQQLAAEITYPVMLKSTAGGGGIGMQVCLNETELTDGFEKVQRLSQTNFKQSGVFLEKYIQAARHIEVQIFGDGAGAVIALGERDCSTQRRNQKVIEETPAPGISDALRQQLYDCAVRLGQAANYRSAGTVEFVFAVTTQQFYFLEVNTRLQVEHGVTETVSKIDLVEWMVRLAAGDSTFLKNYQHQSRGHSIQVRIYAEDANKNFQPSSGLLSAVRFPDNIRCDRWIEAGTEVTPFYDPLLAKVIVQGEDREAAIAQLQTALQESEIAGIETNLEYLRQVIASPAFIQGSISTRYLNTFEYKPRTIDVLDSGTYTTVQDYPGRIGYWDIGVPPSGPMDHLAFRLANRILGNAESAAGLECTVTGPTLRFNCNTVICLTGAVMQATLNGQPVPYWTSIPVNAGSTLKLKTIQGHGYRTYLAIQHGFDVPDYLGSKATFTLGKFGGHAGRTLRTGDVLHLYQVDDQAQEINEQRPPQLIPQYTNAWEIGVLYGPHGAPDFFTDSDIEMLFSTHWTIHHNSARTGIRLIGPKPEWARSDGGEAGLHPSNIHDNAYAIGTIDFTGDMPIILAYDGPSLGGFVCPITIAQAELWKIGQLKPGDTVQFYRLTLEEALQRELTQDRQIEMLKSGELEGKSGEVEKLRSREIDAVNIINTPLPLHSPILHQIPESSTQIAVTYRQAGDKFLLIEYGPLVLDLNLRFRVYTLMEWLRANRLAGIIDLTPGMRSLQVHYDSRVLPVQALLDALIAAESELPAIDALEVPTRIIHLPLSWDDESTQLAIQKYMQSVRSDAPWCPSNTEFIRRINGLDTIEQVREIVFNASYLVMGLGDVYLGAPVATPLDPRHRLVTTKYNPARTWTPENAVGIGGAYMCIYGMEGPGGYQFVGRTVPVWNRYKQTEDFEQPWLLRFFDQIRFFPVSPEELLRYREAVIQGKVKLQIEEETFSLRQYQQFLNANAEDIAAFRVKQRAAFAAERDRWATAGEFTRQDVEVLEQPEVPEIVLPNDVEAIVAHVSANVWQVLVQPGDRVAEGDQLIILEAMKMEIAVLADSAGTITQVFCQPGQTVTAGQLLAAIQSDETEH